MDKKELKKKYVETIQPMRVYRVKNLLNEKIFIAGGLNVHGKINSCRFQLIHASHMNRALQDDFRRNGADHFSFDVLDYLEPGDDTGADYQDELNTLAEMWIEKLQPFDEEGYHKRPLNSK